jgi:hypothetical protein
MSKNEGNRPVACDNARPARGVGLLHMFVRCHPRDVANQSARRDAVHAHVALTPAPSRVLDPGQLMKHGPELRGLQYEATLEGCVQRHVRRRVHCACVEDQARVRRAGGEGDTQRCVARVCVDAKESASSRRGVCGQRHVGLEEAADADASVGGDLVVDGRMRCCSHPLEVFKETTVGLLGRLL